MRADWQSDFIIKIFYKVKNKFCGALPLFSCVREKT